jgi:hypothetical protein
MLCFQKAAQSALKCALERSVEFNKTISFENAQLLNILFSHSKIQCFAVEC